MSLRCCTDTAFVTAGVAAGRTQSGDRTHPDARTQPGGLIQPCGRTGGQGRISRRGHALLETALLLGVFAPLAVVGVRYGWSLYQVQGLHSAVQEAARYGASASMDEGLENGDAAWQARVRNVAVCGKPETCSGSRIPGFEPRHVSVELERAGSSAVVRVSVTGFEVPYPGGVSRFDGKPSVQFPRTAALPLPADASAAAQ